MLIKNRNIGFWIKKSFNPTLIDNVAYDLYCEYKKTNFKDNISTQYVVMRFRENVYSKFYKMAEKIIRLEKLKKLNETKS